MNAMRPGDEIHLAGGEFLMGSHDHYPDEAPVRRVRVNGFFMDRCPITNDRFAEFVDATGHVTVAERPPDPTDFRGARSEDLVPGSLVFTMTDGPVSLEDHRRWWSWRPGASWRHPTGPDSSLEGMGDHPVVHVAHSDARAYAAWSGRDLPTEAEWEFAARGGLEGAEFVWGDVDTQDTRPLANTWQGPFPHHNTELDGWTRTSPVGSYPPNGFGFYDMAGNVWEWTKDDYALPSATQGAVTDGAPKVVKGGSHLCTIQYCFRYRPAARQSQTVDTSTSHIGFRTVRRS